ncbi:MAG: alanine racemase [Candidatus Omnitrophica bacterium]|nr:alanine racemase [Candidatus Omnitrophota bacterium]
MQTKPTSFIAVSERAVPPAQAPVWIEVDLAAIRSNFRQVRRHVAPGVKVLAVIKANGYGHGLLPVAQTLSEAGADFLAVASVVEAVALRRSGVGAGILVLGQCLPEEAPLVVEHRLIQAVGDEPSTRALSRAAVRAEKPACVHLKVDTGMGRYGVWHEEAAALLRRIADLPGIQPQGVFTHLGMAGQNAQATEEQLSQFSRLLGELEREGLPAGLRHAANSVGLIRFPGSHWDLVRTGLLVYGCSPIKGEHPLELRPALSLKSRVRFLKRVAAGRTVSYGGTWAAERPSRVATVPVGYAHGYTRALSNKAQLLVRGRRAPVIGRITMEDLMCDVTDIPGVEVGDEVVLIGRQGEEQVTAEELARAAGTIPYEILVGLSPSIPRRCL